MHAQTYIYNTNDAIRTHIHGHTYQHLHTRKRIKIYMLQYMWVLICRTTWTHAQACMCTRIRACTPIIWYTMYEIYIHEYWPNTHINQPCTYIQFVSHIHTYIHSHKHTHKHACSHLESQTHINIHSPLDCNFNSMHHHHIRHIYKGIQAYIHTPTHMRKHAHIHTFRSQFNLRRVQIQPPLYQAYINTNTVTHGHTDTLIDTYTYTKVHTFSS